MGGRQQLIGGLVCIVVCATIMLFVLIRFRRARTPFDPRAVASTLITDGPFRLSRHPSYIALTLLYFGIGLLLRNGWILLFSVPVLAVMNWWVIPKEEHRLDMKFGEEYRRYKSKVRRWL
jgi:protein-S-isoprenylcysteine O-methyltransferase Ste14